MVCWLFCTCSTGVFHIYNPGALFRKSLFNNIDFLNSALEVVYGKLRYCLLFILLAKYIYITHLILVCSVLVLELSKGLTLKVLVTT